MTRRAAYQAPMLDPIEVTTVGKHQVHQVTSTLTIDDKYNIAELLKEFGSPLYVISEPQLRALFQSFSQQFAASGMDTTVAYSYKTNYLPSVCNILHEEGAWAEIVSGMEYDLARSLGVPPARIIFNGPYKTRSELETALGAGALVNIDGFDELSLVTEVARSLARPARVGLRVNFQYGTAPWTKFGFNFENGDARQALERVAAEPNMRLESIHNHCGTFQLDPQIYARAADVVIAMARRARDLGLEPTIADFGGGFPSNNDLKPVFQPQDLEPVEHGHLASFADAILGPLSKAKGAFGDRPRVVLEPGRAVVDAAMQLACTVVATKEIPGRQSAVVVDAGVNLVPTAYWYNHSIQPVSPKTVGASGLLQPVSIFGPLCMQIDVLREDALLPPLEVGSPLLISNVGAYCLTQSMQFIQPRPAVVLLGPEGAEAIRRRETWRDIFALDSVPERLRQPEHAF